jgi:hypothetical protein
MTWVVDRFEGGYAVLEDIKTMEVSSLLRDGLPGNLREGDVLREKDGAFYIDAAETERRARSARARFDRLKK